MHTCNTCEACMRLINPVHGGQTRRMRNMCMTRDGSAEIHVFPPFCHWNPTHLSQREYIMAILEQHVSDRRRPHSVAGIRHICLNENIYGDSKQTREHHKSPAQCGWIRGTHSVVLIELRHAVTVCWGPPTNNNTHTHTDTRAQHMNSSNEVCVCACMCI